LCHPYGTRYNPADRDKWRRYTVSNEHRDAYANGNHTNEYGDTDRNAIAHQYIDANRKPHGYANSDSHNATGNVSCALAPASPGRAMNDSQRLAAKLMEIQAWNERKDYDERNRLTYEALAMAQECGFLAGIRIDAREPEWPCAFIELPTGQVSWHLPQHVNEWDNHTTEEKQVRMLRFIADVFNK
jgi:hypothetical protein